MFPLVGQPVPWAGARRGSEVKQGPFCLLLGPASSLGAARPTYLGITSGSCGQLLLGHVGRPAGAAQPEKVLTGAVV